MKNKIVLYLLDKGIKPHYKGFDYLIHALTITIPQPHRIPIGQIYEQIAEDFDVTKDRVERCIRTIISTYFDDMDNPPKYKYTNSEFIYLCTEQIRVSEEDFKDVAML